MEFDRLGILRQLYQYWLLSNKLIIIELINILYENCPKHRKLMYTGGKMLLFDVLFVTLIIQRLGIILTQSHCARNS